MSQLKFYEAFHYIESADFYNSFLFKILGLIVLLVMQQLILHISLSFDLYGFFHSKIVKSFSKKPNYQFAGKWQNFQRQTLFICTL